MCWLNKIQTVSNYEQIQAPDCIKIWADSSSKWQCHLLAVLPVLSSFIAYLEALEVPLHFLVPHPAPLHLVPYPSLGLPRVLPQVLQSDIDCTSPCIIHIWVAEMSGSEIPVAAAIHQWPAIVWVSISMMTQLWQCTAGCKTWHLEAQHLAIECSISSNRNAGVLLFSCKGSVYGKFRAAQTDRPLLWVWELRPCSGRPESKICVSTAWT